MSRLLSWSGPLALGTLWLALLQGGCGPEGDSAPPRETAPHRKSYPAPPEGEWYFRDLLAVGPVPLPAPQASGALFNLLEQWAGRDAIDAGVIIEQLAASTDEAALAQLRAGLRHHDASVRYASCAALGRRREEAVAALLMEALRDERQEIALLALEGIIAQDQSWTLPRVIKCYGMHDNNPHLIVRVTAAARLIDKGIYAGVPLLIKVLKENTPIADEKNREWDRTDRIAWEKEVAIAALSRLATSDFGFHQDGPIPQQVAAIRSIEDWWDRERSRLWERTPPWSDRQLARVIDQIIGGLAAFQLRHVDNARFLLEHLGPPAGERLVEAALGGSFYIRFHSLEVLAALAPAARQAQRSSWAQVLVPLLEDSEPAVRQQAALTVGALGGARAVGELLGHLGDADPGVQRSVALALGRIGSPGARSRLQEQLATVGLLAEVRVALLGALAATGEREAAEQFLAGLDDSEETVRQGTLDTLLAITGDDFGLRAAVAEESGGGPLAEARDRALRALLGPRAP
ncbi:MAG: HEAT repeat domain-containing protein [Planctomycetota bacterium]